MDATLYWGFWHPYRDRFDIHADLIGFVKKLDNPSDPEALVEEIVNLMLGVDVAADHAKKCYAAFYSLARSLITTGQMRGMPTSKTLVAQKSAVWWKID